MEAYNIIERHYTETYDEDRHLSSREGQVDFFVTFTWIERVIASLCSELGKKALNILEIGAGTGAYSLELARQCHHVVASFAFAEPADTSCSHICPRTQL